MGPGLRRARLRVGLRAAAVVVARLRASGLVGVRLAAFAPGPEKVNFIDFCSDLIDLYNDFTVVLMLILLFLL